jgi:deazaflavin-dependent oxidoreductase (nitroreductase family)
VRPRRALSRSGAPGPWHPGRTSSDPEYAYLTTTGRRSGQRHTVEIWYRRHGRDVWFVNDAEDPAGRRPDWARNLQADPRAEVRIGDEVLRGRGTVLAADLDDPVQLAVRQALAARYQDWHHGAPLSRWAARGLAVRLEPDDVDTVPGAPGPPS